MMTLLRLFLLTICITISGIVNADCSRHFPAGARDIEIPDVSGVRQSILKNIAPIVEHSISAGLYPGAIVLAAHNGEIIYRGVFGSRRIVPSVAPMTFNTIFDIASLTKVVVTTTAIMQLVEKGKLDLDAKVASYWPAFAHNGKEGVTIRQLLTHTSGFAPELNFRKFPQFSDLLSRELSHKGKREVIAILENTELIHPPGAVFTYSDINFVALGYLVELMSGEDLDMYARKHIFEPIKMRHTFYLPPQEFMDNIAPTEIIKGKLRWGVVHDETAYLMGGISGMAGLFSNAHDLGLFAQCLVCGGRIPHAHTGKHLLGPLTVLKMTTPQTPASMKDVRGLGWDIDSAYSHRGSLFPIHSFGHTGWTGTSMWIDPTTQTWLIILTSRAHPTLAPMNPLIHDRKAIANIIAASITDIALTKDKVNTGRGELARAYRES